MIKWRKYYGKKNYGVLCRKKEWNTETYIKLALAEAKKMGVDVELIRLNECNILPCKACSNMPCTWKAQKDVF